ncbi:MAG TPA: 6-phosphogluconolactonase [Oscillatoriales cyanobacterium M59_W2019_021]|nr:MAG: 6-phosphogluconolactonase [Cyanobacteria bacterium J055]HIK30788.1 6-phosphogluconolactonase [Oscillatoriales cyanobacterium M4454_W2019_049]HIK51973.1 6-phosphogluconolactonase [Oscillatoriales cyanobacterium M59_W2019_021]
MTKIEILADKTALVDRAKELVLAQIETTLAERDRFTIALSGGSTPKPLYEALAAEDLPWEKIHVFWGDERYVPPTHPDSNEKMAREAWLDRVAIPPENIHPMPTGAGDPAIDAQTHDLELQAFFGLSDGEFPRFDVMLLGMGDDGHTASLFPHTEALQVCDRLVTVGNKDGQPRITLTIPVLNRSRCILFLVAGANKQTALREVFAPEGDSQSYPSRFIQPQDGELFWLLDEAAGGFIK